MSSADKFFGGTAFFASTRRRDDGTAGRRDCETTGPLKHRRSQAFPGVLSCA